MSRTTYLGSTLPLRRGSRGFFETTNDPMLNEKSKFINLILTKKGERIANPNFGCDLWKLLFEPKDATTQDVAEQYISDAVQAFMPYLILRKIQIINLDTFVNDHSINLFVQYGFGSNPLPITDSIQILLGSNIAGGLYTSGKTTSRNF